eukprot:GSMAST32.ASY1.ANO1.1164.1 assembled CDS
MRLLMFRSMWGVLPTTDGVLAGSKFQSLKQAVAAVANLGYDGIEVPYKLVEQEGKENVKKLLSDYDLKINFHIFTDGPVAPGCELGLVCGGPYKGHPRPDSSVESHLDVFKSQVEAAQEFNPIRINSHSGNDYFTFDQATEFFSKALEFEKSGTSGGYTNVCHEHHRKHFF